MPVSRAAWFWQNYCRLLPPRTGFAGCATASLHSDARSRKSLRQDIRFPSGSVQSGSSCNVNRGPWAPGNDSGGIQAGEVLSIHAGGSLEVDEVGAQRDRENKALEWGSGTQVSSGHGNSQLCAFPLLSFSFSAGEWREAEQGGADKVLRSHPYDSSGSPTGLHSFT